MSQLLVSNHIESIVQNMMSFLKKALIFFSLAWFCLTVGVFTAYPVSSIGIFFLCIGLIFLVISIVYLVRYRNASMRVRKAMERQ